MTGSIPWLLRLRVLTVQPRLTLTEIQLVDTTLLYRRLDGRNHVPIEVRAIRPPAADWMDLRHLLDETGVWRWPRRFPRVHDGYVGEFAIAIEWDRRGVMSVGALGAAPEVDDVVDEVQRLVGNAPRRSSRPVPTLLSPAPPPPYQPDASDFPDRALALPAFRDSGTSAARITPR